MTFQDYVKNNQKILQKIKDRVPGEEIVDMYYGTLDYAVSRSNSILLKLSQDKIKEQKHEQDVAHCSKVINDFYRYTVKYSNASILLRWYYKNCLHGLGINQIPKVKKLLNSLDN